MAEIDPGAIGQIFGNIKTVDDYNKANQNFQLQRLLAGQQLQTGAIDQATKTNVLATQVLAGAQDQPTWNAGLQKLDAAGVDISQFAPDFATGQKQVQALKLAQSPLLPLVNAATQLSTMTGNVSPLLQNLNLGGAQASAASTPGATTASPAAPTTLAPNPAAAVAAVMPPQSSLPTAAANTPAQAPVPTPASTTAAGLPAAPSFNPPANDPTKTQAANQAAYQQALETYKADPATVAATESAKDTGANFAKDSQSAAQAQAIFGKLQENINALRTLNPDTPSDAIIGANTQAAASNNLAGLGLGAGDAASKVAQWHQIDTQQTLNELSQLVQSGAIRSNKAIVQLLSTGASIPVGLNQSGRAQMLDNLESELKNAVASSQNVQQFAAGQAQTTPYSPINVNSQNPVATAAAKFVTPAKPNPQSIPMTDVTKLKSMVQSAANPAAAQQAQTYFDQIHGPGAAALVLGK